MTKLKIKHHGTTPDISAPVFYATHAKKCLSSSLPFSWDILRHFFTTGAQLVSGTHLEDGLSVQKCALEHMAHLYLGTRGGSAEVTPKPGHRCHTPAGQLELL